MAANNMAVEILKINFERM